MILSVNITERIREAMNKWQFEDEFVSGIDHDNAANNYAYSCR